MLAKERIALALDPDLWFQRFCELPSVTLAAMPTSVLVSSTRLPGRRPRDPADRIIGDRVGLLGRQAGSRPRSRSSRRSARSNAIASPRLRRASSLVLP